MGAVDYSLEDRRTVLRHIREMREQKMVRRTDVLRWALSIPRVDRYLLGVKYPDLNSRDAETRTRAWKKFMASSESRPYRVT